MRLDADTAGSSGSAQWARPSFTGGFPVSFSPTTGWDAALSRRSSTLCSRAPNRTRWLAAGFVCSTYRSLSRVSAPPAVPKSATTIKARRVSAVYWPVSPGSSISEASPPAPGETFSSIGSSSGLWGDWQRRFHRREVVKLLARQRVDVRVADASSPTEFSPVRPLSRAQRARYRLSWAQRLARNAALHTSSSLSITLFGIPDAFADAIGLSTR